MWKNDFWRTFLIHKFWVTPDFAWKFCWELWMLGEKINFFVLIFSVHTAAFSTGKSLQEALILWSTNPQYDKRFFVDLPGQYMKTKAQNMLCTQIVFCFYIQNNLCTQHVLNWYINEQSFVILWVSWCENKCFWKRFTCILYAVSNDAI